MDPTDPPLRNVEMAPDYTAGGDPKSPQANTISEDQELSEANSSSDDEDLSADQYLTRVLRNPTDDC